MENDKPEKMDESSPLAWFNKGLVLMMICMVLPLLAATSAWELYKWNSHRGDLVKVMFPGVIAVVLLAWLYRRRKTIFPSEMVRWRRIFFPASAFFFGTLLVFVGGAWGMTAEAKRFFDAPAATSEDVEWFLAQKENKLVALCLPDAAGKMTRAIIIQGEWGREGKPPEFRDIEILSIPFFMGKDVEAGVCCAAKDYREAILDRPPPDGVPAVGPPPVAPMVTGLSSSCWDVRNGNFHAKIRGQLKRVPVTLLLAARAAIRK